MANKTENLNLNSEWWTARQNDMWIMLMREWETFNITLLSLSLLHRECNNCMCLWHVQASSYHKLMAIIFFYLSLSFTLSHFIFIVGIAIILHFFPLFLWSLMMWSVWCIQPLHSFIYLFDVQCSNVNASHILFLS
jgi:hypothetical protein